jgi:hypothetical protein
MELKCNGCQKLKHYFDFDWCMKLKEALPNGYAKLYWGERCGEVRGRVR